MIDATSAAYMPSRLTIYLADFTYGPEKSNIDGMPLAIGNLAAYLDAAFPELLDIQLFRYSDSFDHALGVRTPHIVGFSNYCWNERISNAWASVVKSVDDSTLVVMGGPNYPLELNQELVFLKERPDLDVYVRQEGEEALRILVHEFMDANRDIEQLRGRVLPNCSLLDRHRHRLIRHSDLPRISNLDDIPSPYLNHFMDQFFDGDLMPMIQTNRGCPFTCTFCNSGVEYLTKVNKHSSQRVRADLEYIARLMATQQKPLSVLRIVDDNFAMFKEDLDTVKVLVDLEKRTGFPHAILTTTGKNRHDRILEAVALTDGKIEVTAAVQSMNPETLTAIRRDNIKVDSYFQIIETVAKRGLVTRSDTILGLPNETKDSYFGGMRTLFDVGIQEAVVNQLYLMMGSELNSEKERSRWKLRSHWRAVPVTAITIRDIPVIEVEEIVTSTSTMTMDDYYECRFFQLWLVAYGTGGKFDPLCRLLRECEVNFVDFLLTSQKLLHCGPASLQEVFAEYECQARGELFESKAEAVAFYCVPEHFEALARGDIGDALLNRYLVQLTMLHMTDLIKLAEDGAREALKGAMTAEREEEFRSVMSYIRGLNVMSSNVDGMAPTQMVRLQYDIDRWKQDAYARPLSEYRLTKEQAFSFSMSARDWEHIHNQVATNGSSVRGLMKIRRNTNNMHFLRRVVDGAGVVPFSETTV